MSFRCQCCTLVLFYWDSPVGCDNVTLLIFHTAREVQEVPGVYIKNNETINFFINGITKIFCLSIVVSFVILLCKSDPRVISAVYTKLKNQRIKLKDLFAFSEINHSVRDYMPNFTTDFSPFRSVPIILSSSHCFN